MSEELRDCPFCGSNDVKRNDKLTKGIEGVVECQECGACGFAGDWNTRPIEDRLTAERNAARAALAVATEALEYYADIKIYRTGGIESDGTVSFSWFGDVNQKDRGECARNALARIGKGER